MTGSAPISGMRGVKAPPFLLLAGLLFWGWQSDYLILGAVMGVILESTRFIKLRLELADEDFRRIWTFCTLLALALALYTFSTDEEGGGFSGLFHASTANAGRNASISTVHTATALLRWLPMTLFLLVAAQMFSERESVPLSAISLYLRWRRRKDANPLPERNVNVTYPYFIVCLFSAGIHVNEVAHSFFWGQCLLLPWALWPLRSRRFSIAAWLSVCALVIALGFAGQFGISQAGRLLEGYNAQWMANWLRQRTDASQSVTAIGQIGKLKLSPRIVIWLEPENGSLPPTYLREASYRSYHSQGQTWYAGSGGARNEFEDIAHPNNDNWILLPDKTNASAVNIACYLDGRSRDTGDPEGLLPLPTGSYRLENLPVFTLKKSQTGAVLASGPSFVIFDTFYGPGATIDAPPDAKLDYAVPTNEAPALDQVIAEMKIARTTEAQKLRAVQSFFADKFTYSTWQKMDKQATTNESSLTKFLLHSRSGHCEYFATATVLLLRELKIPARYVVGYYVHEIKGSGYVVRERDAHAWCLVWNKKTGTWENFDTTPASWVAAEGGDVSEWFSDFWSWIRFEISKGKLRLSQGNLREYALWALIPLMALLLYQIIFRRRKRLLAGRNKKSTEIFFWPGLDSEFYQLEKKLAERGVPRQPGEPLSEWLERALAEPALAGLREPLQQLLRLHYRHRFDPRGLGDEERVQLRRDAKTCLNDLLQTKAK